MDTALVPSPMVLKAVVHPAPRGGYWAEVPGVPGCYTRGDTLDDILRRLSEAVTAHLDVQPGAVRIGLLELAA